MSKDKMNEVIRKIIKQAVNHEIENDEKLYQKLQDMRKWGGTASMREYWKEFNFRFNRYKRVFETEISYQLNELVKKYLLLIILIMTFSNIFFSAFIGMLIYHLH